MKKLDYIHFIYVKNLIAIIRRCIAVTGEKVIS